MDPGPLLNIVLRELKDGVIVCDRAGEISLFNQAAAGLFGPGNLLEKGRSLYDFCCRPPVEQALDLLHYQHHFENQPGSLPFVQFLNGAVGLARFFRCRVSFLPSTDPDSSFVIILEDISAWYTPDNPLFMKIEEFRAPMTNLRAAVESLTEYPEMSPVMRSAFENVLVQESLNLTAVFESLARSCQVLMQAQSHLAELSTAVLFGYVRHHLNSRKIPVSVATGQNAGVKVDIYGLILILDRLAAKIRQKQKKIPLACETRVGEHFIYLDFLWPGKFLTTGTVQSILDDKLEHSVGEMTVGAILQSMGGDIWSQQQDHGKSVLRLALPITDKPGS